MNVIYFKVILAMLIFCNVIGVGLFLYANEAGTLEYAGLIGSVIFGSYISTCNQPKRP
tara:strand:- start:641 stop:814 length:174 start_codon:yes stop_codon:yes gene_type:complete